MHPLVSVITPTFNSERYIRETANSVIKQSFSNWEWLVVDDHSTDLTRKILTELADMDSRIKPLFLSKNYGGPAKPRNVGLENAKGQYICFLDSDDIWLENKIKKQLETINEADAICSNFSIINKDSKIVKNINPIFSKYLFKTELYKQLIWYFNPININTSMIKNNTNIRFNENKEFAAIEDWIFWTDYVRDNKKFIYIEDILIKYRVHEDSMSSWSSTKSYMKTISYLKFANEEKKLNFVKFFVANIIVYFKIFVRKIKTSFYYHAK